MQIKQEKGHYTLYKENEVIGTAVVDGATILRLEIAPQWRGRGYSSYLVKELLRRGGGLDPKQATRFTAPLPRDEAGRALARRFDFMPEGNRLVRMKGDKALIGTFAKAKITDSNTWALYGEAVEE